MLKAIPEAAPTATPLLRLYLDDSHGDRIEDAKLLLQGAMGILGEMNTANDRAERLEMLTSVHYMMNIAAQLVANEYHEEASHD